jgi:AcrR family transcriptional regulator
METSHRISNCARLLADEFGLDGFTMDDLAAKADVSRRTLFNYFPGKDAAVHGEKPPLPESLVDTFRNGGPTGDLISDLVAMVDALLSTHDIDREEVALMRRVMHANPRLITQAKDDFGHFREQILDAIRAREGSAYDDTRARVVIHVTGALFELAIDHYVEHPDRELAELFKAAVDALRSAFE